MCLAVLEPEQLHQMVSPLLKPVRHTGQPPCRQQRVGTPGRIRERALRGFDRRQRFLGPAHAYEPITARGRVDRGAMLAGVDPLAVDPVPSDRCRPRGHVSYQLPWKMLTLIVP